MKIKEKLEIVKKGAAEFFLPVAENDYRAKIFKGNFLIYFFFAAVILKSGFALFLYTFSNNPFYADITKTALIELTNAERAKHNLPKLNENEVLSRAAYMKALDMANNGYFSHVSPAGIDPWHWFESAGYNYKYAGENLAIGFLDSREVQDAWAASPTHKANIVNGKYREIGIAVLKANYQGNPATIVVQMFGSKLGASQNPLAFTAAETSSGKTGDIVELAAKDKEVLGAATVSAAEKNKFAFKVAAFFAQSYFNLVQALIYASLVLVILLLLANFALRADFDHADLLAKAMGFIAVMAVFSLLDRNLVSALIPHSFLIQ
ncbi:MAG: CAP domain-containing protein [Candidatus Paceibacterota bacterium]